MNALLARLQWVVVLCALAAGCGSGNATFTPIANATGAPAIPSQGGFSVAQVTLAGSPAPGATGLSIALPAVTAADGATFGGSAVFPVPASVPGNLLFTEIVSNAALVTSLPVLQDTLRTAQSQRRPLAAAIAPFLYIEIVADLGITFPNAPAFALTVPASQIVADTTYYLAQYDLLRPSLGWQLGFEGPASIDGTTIAFAGPSPASPVSLLPEVPLYFALYAVSNSAPSPSPAPSATPAAATVPFTFSPGTLTLAAGASGAVTIVDPSGYTGSYAVTSTASNVVTASVSGTTITVNALAAGDAWVVASATSSNSQLRTLPFNVQVTGTPGGSSGAVDIGVPTPAPVICSPAPVSVPAGQSAVIDCTASGYIGAFTTSVADPAIASVQLATGTTTFFYVNGLQAGTTTFSLQSASGGSGSDTVTVTP